MKLGQRVENVKRKVLRLMRIMVWQILLLMSVLSLIGLVVFHAVRLATQPSSEDTSTSPTKSGYDSVYKKYRFAAVTTDTNICSQIGVNILRARGGSAVDAAIASMFCVGIVNCQSTGIGGGHFATIYDTPRGGTKKVLVTLISREKAPENAYRDMFVNRTELALKGGLAIAVPGEVSGHYAAWRKFGRLPWADLVIPSVDLSEQGFIVEKALAGAIRQYEETIRNDSNFATLLRHWDSACIILHVVKGDFEKCDNVT